MLIVTATVSGQSMEPVRSEKPVLRAAAAAEFPLETDGGVFESVGFGGIIQGAFPIRRAYPLYVASDLGYTFLRLRMDNSVSLVSISLGAGVAVDIGQRIQFLAGAGIGGYAGFLNNTAVNPDTSDVYPNQSGYAMYWKASMAANIFFTPSFSLGLYGSYNNYVGLVQSISTGIFVSLNFDGLNPNVHISDPDLLPIYPALSKSYDTDGVGTLTFENRERFTLENVTVQYRVDGLMTEPVTCRTFESVESAETHDVNLVTALGTAGLAQISDELSVSEVLFSYDIAGGKRQISLTPSIHILNRNALTWDDDRKAAAFIDSRDADVLRFSKEVARIVQGDGRDAINANLRTAIAMYEAMGVQRISYVRDPHSPAFVDTHQNESLIDYIQYPNQTLKYRGGDCDDLTILYCSLLESIGIETALVTVPGHIYPAVDVKIHPSQLDTLYAPPDRFIVQGEKTWLPIEITVVGLPFEEAWSQGSRQWAEAALDGRAQLYPVGEAWSSWANVGTPDDVGLIDHLDAQSVRVAYANEIDRHISRQLAAATEPVLQRLEERPGDSRLLNRLGIIYAGYGLWDRAEEYFNDANVEGIYLPATTNLGNLYLLRGRLTDAVRMYQDVLGINPDNRYALAGMAKASSLLGERQDTEIYLAELNQQDAEMGHTLAAVVLNEGGYRAGYGDSQRVEYWAEE